MFLERKLIGASWHCSECEAKGGGGEKKGKAHEQATRHRVFFDYQYEITKAD